MISQTKLSKKANISKGRISQIVNGNGNPSLELAKRLAALFPDTTAWEWMENSRDTWAKVKTKNYDFENTTELGE